MASKILVQMGLLWSSDIVDSTSLDHSSPTKSGIAFHATQQLLGFLKFMFRSCRPGTGSENRTSHLRADSHFACVCKIINSLVVNLYFEKKKSVYESQHAAKSASVTPAAEVEARQCRTNATVNRKMINLRLSATHCVEGESWEFEGKRTRAHIHTISGNKSV